LTFFIRTEVKEGLNHIVVDSVQFGNQEMIMEKDVAVEMKDYLINFLSFESPFLVYFLYTFIVKGYVVNSNHQCR
jgi:hypothetical protein